MPKLARHGSYVAYRVLMTSVIMFEIKPRRNHSQQRPHPPQPHTRLGPSSRHCVRGMGAGGCPSTGSSHPGDTPGGAKLRSTTPDGSTSRPGVTSCPLWSQGCTGLLASPLRGGRGRQGQGRLPENAAESAQVCWLSEQAKVGAEWPSPLGGEKGNQ